jgi:hypothetical protein
MQTMQKESPSEISLIIRVLPAFVGVSEYRQPGVRIWLVHPLPHQLLEDLNPFIAETDLLSRGWMVAFEIASSSLGELIIPRTRGKLLASVS